MPNPKKYLDNVGLTEYTSLLKDYISDQQHTIDGYYDVTTTHKFYEHYDNGTFSDEITGAIGNIYVDLLTNKLYKYDNNAYVEITTSVSTDFESTGISAGTITINGTSNTIKVPIEFDGTYDASTNKAATVSTVTNAVSEIHPITNGYYDRLDTKSFYEHFEYGDPGEFIDEITGVVGNIYLDFLTNKLYRYDYPTDTSVDPIYIEIVESTEINNFISDIKVEKPSLSTELSLNGARLSLFSTDDSTESLILNNISIFRNATKSAFATKNAIYDKIWYMKDSLETCSITGRDVWTDGNNIYYSLGNVQYILDRATSTWVNKTWTGLTNATGANIWTDGENIYYSYNSTQYVLNVATSTWSSKSWTGLTNFLGQNVWTDGDNIYCSSLSNQYVLNKSTSTWETKTWTGLTSFNGSDIWTDGDNIYYSSSSTQYVLDKTTSTWSTKTWTGLTNFNGSYVWKDLNNTIYYSNSSNSLHYVLDKSTSNWSVVTWANMTGLFASEIDGIDVWTDGTNVYNSGSFELVIVS